MKRFPAYLAAAAAALFWAADGRAQNAPDDFIASHLPYLRVPLAGNLPTSFVKLRSSLAENDFDLSTNLPKSFVRIAEELRFSGTPTLAGFLPTSFVKLRSSLPQLTDSDPVAQYSPYLRNKLSDQLPTSYTKIGGQYPTPEEK
jgi:hypothetical protein